MEKKKSQIKIEIDENIGKGEYSNFAIVTHSPAEFIIDFISILPGVTKSKVKSRIVMPPMPAKTLMQALKDQVDKYEKKVGEIKVISNAPTFNLPDKKTPPN